jgi:hypothetical protein
MRESMYAHVIEAGCRGGVVELVQLQVVRLTPTHPYNKKGIAYSQTTGWKETRALSIWFVSTAVARR